MEKDAISDVGKALQQIAHYHRKTLGLKFDPDGKYWSILKWILDLYFQPCNLEPGVPNTSNSVDWSIAKGVKKTPQDVNPLHDVCPSTDVWSITALTSAKLEQTTEPALKGVD